LTAPAYWFCRRLNCLFEHGYCASKIFHKTQYSRLVRCAMTKKSAASAVERAKLLIDRFFASRELTGVSARLEGG
jgi:hypothetical protein